MFLSNLLPLLILLLPTLALAENATDFVPLVGIPYVDTTKQSTTLGDYVNGLYWASISIAAILAFLKITWAGIKYMMSEIVTDKQSAKSDIKGALLGLIIILGAVLVLDTINPSIKKLTALTLVPLKGDVTQPDTRTICQREPTSEACCASVPGTYVLTDAGPICNPLPQPGEIIDDDIYETGDDLNDQRTCELDNNVWDPTLGVCREPGETLIPIPTSYTSEFEKSTYCSGISARYDETRNVCVMLE